MLRLLSIRDFVVVEALDLEFDAGFSALTGETGAGKSILLDALGLLLGDRFEARQLRPGAARAELAAAFDIADNPAVADWLAMQGLAGEGDEVLLRRVLDAQGKSRAWINGRPATVAQLDELGALLVDLHGQHAHQSLLSAGAQRDLVDAFGGFAILTGEVAAAWEAWREADAAHRAALSSVADFAEERDRLQATQQELSRLAVAADEWATLSLAQTRLAHAAALIEAAVGVEDALTESDDALSRQLASLIGRLEAQTAHDPSLLAPTSLLESARIQLVEAARALRSYRDRLDVDPAELQSVEARLSAIHDAARRHRVRPEALPGLLADTEARLSALAREADPEPLARRAAACEATYRALAEQLSAKRQFAASELEHRVTATMQELAMAGGRFEVALEPLPSPASHGLERVEFRVASHPRQPLGPLSRVASGGELSRLALAIQVATSAVAAIPTLIFDEVDAGIGGTVAATVGRLMRRLSSRRQVMCVTHLPQVAAFATTHYRVTKSGDDEGVRSDVTRLSAADRIEEIARMLAGSEITAKTRAHARELLAEPRTIVDDGEAAAI